MAPLSTAHQTTKRIDFIDLAKALGIFLVVYAHTQLDERVQNWIYVFHMPLFFFISGYLFRFARNKEWSLFAKKRFAQIVVPYILINAVTYLFWVFIGRHFGADSGDTTSVWSPLLAALTCHGEKMVHDVPLWFLLCLFIIEIAYHAIFRGKTARQRWMYIAAFAAVGTLNCLYNHMLLPFSIGTALHGIVFYAVGNELRRHEEKGNTPQDAAYYGNKGEKTYRNKWKGTLADTAMVCLCLAMTIVIAHANGRINMHKNYYGNIVLFYLGGFSGIAMTLAACRIAARWLHGSRVMGVVRIISNDTLYICGFHLMTFSLLKGVLVYGFGFNLAGLNDTIFANLAFSAAALAVCTCAICLARRWVPTRQHSAQT